VPRLRLGVVLLIPGPARAEIVGLQRALGARPRVAPHVTLVPPVNVRDDRLAEALAVVRSAAAAVPPLRLELGPPATFWPDAPVVHLAVGGDVEGVRRLRETVSVAPLDRIVTWPFVPHVTLAEELAPEHIAAAVGALGAFEATVTVTHVHVLEQDREDRRWKAVADAPLGGSTVVGRGGLELELTTGDVLEPSPDRRIVVRARREGAAAGIAVGHVEGDEAWVDRLDVDASLRGQGIGTRLLGEIELAAARRGCRRAWVTCPAPAAGWFAARGWVVDLRLPAWRSGQDWVRLGRALPG
jgi:2'-5' RNA ligase/predicted GNAT family acetyltransferase